MTEPGNLFLDLPGDLSAEVCETLLTTDHCRLERIVSLGQASPEGFWYDQETHEWVLLVRGAARLRFEGEEQAIELRPGSYLDIPAHRRHRVEWTDPATPTIWLALHFRDVPVDPGAVLQADRREKA
jgi:cupin 2 domain-containing protein